MSPLTVTCPSVGARLPYDQLWLTCLPAPLRADDAERRLVRQLEIDVAAQNSAAQSAAGISRDKTERHHE